MPFASRFGLEIHGIQNINHAWWNLSSAALGEYAIRRREGIVAHRGPLVVRTGQHTGRSPNDKFIVREPTSDPNIWWGTVNRPMEAEQFEGLRSRLLAHLQGRDLFVQDCYAGADPDYRIPIRIITETAWQSLFARNMFIRERDPERLQAHQPEFTVICAPSFNAQPAVDGTNSEVFILVHFGSKLVLIGGTSYAGEIKKSIFTILNYVLPLEHVLSMHCSANYGAKSDDVALFFGLSGTGKTTLSTSRDRVLVGDDEHGWSDRGIFNFEGGCYAKVIRISRDSEPEIFATTEMFGTILENVAIDSATRRLDLNSDALTENTRAAYPIESIPNATPSGIAGHPRNLLFLAADAFGVLPPLARLSRAQAMYHFLSGYTAKVAGTERGITEPKVTFSVCFGAPFMALRPAVYAQLLGEKIAKHDADVWLVNTGWSGGPHGVGRRMKLEYTRAMVRSVLDGSLSRASYSEDPLTGALVPNQCPGVPSNVLNQRSTWPDPSAYDRKGRELATRFADNFKQFESQVGAEIKDAGLRILP